MRLFTLCCLLLYGSVSSQAQTVAERRAARMGLGVNLSYLENYWNGNKAVHFSNFVNFNDIPKRRDRLAEIARVGFKTVRLPVCFGAWATVEPPYRWDAPQYLAAPDSLVKWALDNNLTTIIDLHHVEFDGSIRGADTTARLVWLWQQIAERYKHTDPERVLFELRNEPHGMSAAAWRAQATLLIETVRRIAPNHTLIVGFHNWNGLDQMIQSDPFPDPNIIYTFHFYDPFIFTHQSATWAGSGLSDLRNVPFPANPAVPIAVPASARGTWVEGAITNYAREGTYERLYSRLAAAKDWSVVRKVPIFLGEFGSYNAGATPESRCRHAEAVYFALGRLQIPSAWWEWDQGFSMFTRGTFNLMPCMVAAINTFTTGELLVLGTEPAAGPNLRAYPNPTTDTLRLQAPGAVQVRLTDAAGRTLGTVAVGTGGTISLANYPAGAYALTVLDRRGKVLGGVRVLKR